MNKQKEVLEIIFKECRKKNNYTFNNDLVKDVSKDVGFGNPFTATKIDKKESLPDVLKENDYAVIHLGKGCHKFVKGIDKLYHTLEPIKKNIEWTYRRSLLNQYNSSESNMLSVANNQRILQHFTFGEASVDLDFTNLPIEKRPKTYFPHRTQQNFDYNILDNKISCTRLQIEIDLTIEYNGDVGVFEAKKGKGDNFSIYQIYHPFLYYHNAKSIGSIGKKIKNIFAIFVRQDEVNKISMWKYTFSNPNELTSIKFLDSTSYELIE